GGFMRTVIALLFLGTLAAGQDDKARERLQQELHAVSQRAADLREQIATLPRESALREEKIRHLRQAELDFELLGEKLRNAAPKKEAGEEGPVAFKLKEVRLLESRYAVRAKNPLIVEGESLWLRLTTTGLKRTEEGIAFAFDVRLLDASGKAVVSL